MDMEPSPCSNPLHLLLIEDDPTVAEVIVELLRVRGHRVTHALHGLEALVEVTLTRFDACLCDLDLPGLDGAGLIVQLRAQGQSFQSSWSLRVLMPMPRGRRSRLAAMRFYANR